MKKPAQLLQLPGESSLYRTDRIDQFSQNDEENQEPFDALGGFNKRSFAWKYFDYDKKSNVACCKLCYAVYLVRKSVTTPMMRHLREEHSNQLGNRSQRFLEDYHPKRQLEHSQILEIQQHQNIPLQSSHSYSQLHLQLKDYFFFNHHSQSSVCQICGKIVIFNNKLQILRSHLTEQHEINLDKGGISGRNSEYKIEGRYYFEEEDLLRKNQSVRRKVWQYFVFLEDQKKSMCKLCNQWIVTPNQQPIAIIRHLQAIHPEIIQQKMFNEDNSDWDSDSDEVQQISDCVEIEKIKAKTVGQQQVIKPFIIDNEQCLAACLWCRSIYFTKGNDRSKFNQHIKVMHPGVILEQLCKQETVSLQQMFKKEQQIKNTKLPKLKQISLCQNSEQKLTTLNFESSAQSYQLEITSFIKNLSSMFSQSKDELHFLMMKMKEQLGFSVVENSKTDEDKIVVFRRDENRKQGVDIVGFWEYHHPIKNSKLKSIVYVTLQTKDLSPECTALCFILHDSIQGYSIMLNKIQQIYSKGINCTVCCSLQSKMRISLELFNKKTNENKNPFNMIYLPSQILSNPNQSRSELKMIRERLFNCEKIEREPFFIGMILCENFIKRVRMMMPYAFGVHGKLSDLFNCLLSALDNQAQNGENPNQILTQTPQIIKLKPLLSPSVYNKLCITSLFCKSITFTKKQNDIFVIQFFKNDSQNSKESLLVKYKEITGDIECDCNFKKWVGLPCAHILLVAEIYQLPLKNFINYHWFVKSTSLKHQELERVSVCSKEPQSIENEEKYDDIYWR